MALPYQETAFDRLHREAVIAQEKRDAEQRRLELEAAKKSYSAKQLDKIINEEFDRSFLFLEFNTKVAKHWLDIQPQDDKAAPGYLNKLKTFDRALRHPLMGLTFAAEGLSYKGETYPNTEKLQAALELSIFENGDKSVVDRRSFAMLIEQVLTMHPDPEDNRTNFGSLRMKAEKSNVDHDYSDMTSDDGLKLLAYGLTDF